MCYNDNGPKGASYNETTCPLVARFDCNKDDYFNPLPLAGSYLATHWNLAGSYNKFLLHN